MLQVMVTGGNGFIGQQVVRRLYDLGYEPFVLDRVKSPDAVTHLGDVRDPVAVSESMAHADGWIHLAGVLGTQETIRNPRPAVTVNLIGGLNVLEAAVEHGVPGVNIAVGNHWMNNTYAITKSAMERFVEMYVAERGAQVTTVRALNAYGPRQSVAAPYGSSKVRKIVPSFICRALVGDPIEVYGDGDQVMDMIHVRDVAGILTTMLSVTIKNGHQPLIQAGTGRKTTVLEVAEAVLTATNSSSVINHLPMRPGEPASSVVLADTTTLTNQFPTLPEGLIPLEEGLAETADWYAKKWLPGWQR